MYDDLIVYQKTLKTIAFNILKDNFTAEDIVQDTYIWALENNKVLEYELKEKCKAIAFEILNKSRKDPAKPDNTPEHWTDEDDYHPVWSKLQSSEDSAVQIETYQELREIIKHKNKNRRNKTWLTFDQALEYVAPFKFINQFTYWNHIKKNNIALPFDPAYTYPDKWQGWTHYLSKEYINYEDFKVFVRNTMVPNGITTVRLYQKKYKYYDLNLPGDPNFVYRGKWEGWRVLFWDCKKRSKGSQRKEFLSYEDAQKYVQETLVPKGINTIRQWENRIDEVPLFLPVAPHDFYKRKGWTCSKDFFGVEVRNNLASKRKTESRSYKEAREWSRLNLRSIGIDTQPKFRKWVKGDLEGPTVPSWMPSQPYRDYKKEWAGWGDFLGTYRKSTKNRVYWPYKKAKEWVTNNLIHVIKEGKQYKEYVKGILKNKNLPPLPEELPKYPAAHYKDKGWKSWAEFLSLQEKITFVKKIKHVCKKYMSYEEAKEYFKRNLVPLGIISIHSYTKMKAKPDCLPADIKQYYEKTGEWISAVDFLGSDFKSPVKNKSK